VKGNLARSTHRVALPSGDVVFVKRDRVKGPLEAAKFLVLASRAKAELDALALVRSLGIAAPEPLAALERTTGPLLREATLVTRAIPGVVTLRERLDDARLEGAGRILRALHDARLFHRDYHAGNILVREDGSLALVDLQKLQRWPRLPRAARLRDLAVFLHDLSDVLTPEGRERFLAAYGAEADVRAPLLRAVARRRTERLASRGKRCVLRSSGFRIEAAPGERIYRREDVPVEAVRAAITGHRRTIEQGPGAPGFVKKDPPTTCISRQPWPSAAPGAGGGVGGGASVAVKEFPSRGLLYALSSLVRRHRGREAWMAAHALLLRGVETPLPLALVEERRWGLVFASAVLSRWLSPAEDAHLFADRRFAQGRDTAPEGPAKGPWGEGPARAPLGHRGEALAVRAFARFVARLHEEGIYHGDLKLPNFLVVDGTGGAPPSFALLDLDAVKEIGVALSTRRRAKNLAQIEDYTRYYLPQVKRTHRARFLAEYARSFADARAIAPLVEEHVRFRWARREAVKARLSSRGRAFHDR